MEAFNGELIDILAKTKEYKEYFEGTLESLYQEETERKEVKRYGFLWLSKETKTVPETNCFAVVKIQASGIKMRIPITKELFKALVEEKKVGEKVSIHLNFSYDFTCWHLDSQRTQPVLDVV